MPDNYLKLSAYNMKLQLASVAFFAVTTCATSDSGCSNDNCARAVTGTQLGDFHPSIARVDCSSFFQKTTTPVATIYTTEVLATTTQTIQAKRQIPTPGIPFYARVCTKPGSYVSACSCLGVLPHTTTAAVSIHNLNLNVADKCRHQPWRSSQMPAPPSTTHFLLRKALRRLAQYVRTPFQTRWIVALAAMSAHLAFMRMALVQRLLVLLAPVERFRHVTAMTTVSASPLLDLGFVERMLYVMA